MTILPLLTILACRDEEAPPYYNVGGFQVKFSVPLDELGTDPDAVMTVSTAAAPDHLLWSSPPGQAFVAAASADLAVEYGAGSYVVSDEVDDTCSDMSVVGAEKVGDDLVITGGLDDCDLEWTLTLAEASSARLSVDLEMAGDAAYNRLSLIQSSSKTDHVVGLGAMYSRVDLKHAELPIWCQEQGAGRGGAPLTEQLSDLPGNPAGTWATTYTCAPVFYTSSGTLDSLRGFYLENTELVRMDFTEADRIRAEVTGARLRGGVLAGDDLAGMVRSYSEWSGRMEPLPSWSQTGAIVGVGGGSDAVRALVEELRAASTPLAGVVIEDWTGTRETSLGSRPWWSWEPDATLYPDWSELLSELNGLGVKPLLYYNPYLSSIADRPGATRDLLSEAAAAGYLVMNADGAVYTEDQGGFDAVLVDLTSPDAAAWLAGIMAEQVALGAAGWLADMGEGPPPDAVLASGEDPLEAHNTWPLRWAELNADVAASTGQDLLTMHRGGSGQSPGETRAFWLGEQTASWDADDGLGTVVPALLSSGVSGFSLEHPDAGGAISVASLGVTRDEELLQRWTELATFTALLRTTRTTEPDSNAQIDASPEVQAHLTRMATVYAALSEARAELMMEASTSGVPLVRPMFLGWPDESAAWDLTQQFMLGDHLLVAPVVEMGEDQVDVWLPPGHWIHLWSGESMGDVGAGTWARVDAPLGEPAVFWPLDDQVGVGLAAALEAAGLMD